MNLSLIEIRTTKKRRLDHSDLLLLMKNMNNVDSSHKLNAGNEEIENFLVKSR